MVIIFTQGVRTSVRPSQKQKRATMLTLAPGKQKTRATTDTMCVDNDHLLAVAWWVTLKSPDLFHFQANALVGAWVWIIVLLKSFFLQSLFGQLFLKQ